MENYIEDLLEEISEAGKAMATKAKEKAKSDEYNSAKEYLTMAVFCAETVKSASTDTMADVKNLIETFIPALTEIGKNESVHQMPNGVSSR